MAHKNLYDFASSLNAFDSDKARASRALDQIALWHEQNANENEAKSVHKDGLEHCFRTIADKPALLAQALLAWLASDQRLGLSHDLLETVEVQYIERSQLLDFDLHLANVEDAILCGYRLCGFSTTPTVALSWIFSIHRDFPESAAAQQHADYLATHYAAEYPSSALKLVSDDPAPLAMTPLASKIRNHLQMQRDRGQAIPRFKELEMTLEMQFAMSSLLRQRNRFMSENSQSGLLFELFGAPKYFKYAHRTAVSVRQESKTHETSIEMATISVSIELPLSELTDPLKSLMLRNQLMQGPR